MTAGDQLAIAAIVVAAISILVAWRSHVVAKKAFRLAETEHEERYLSVRAYLIWAYKRRIESVTYCFFAVSYTNQATVANSISSVDLEIEYTDSNGLLNKVKIRPTSAEAPSFQDDGLSRIDVPKRLDARESVSGWYTFAIPKNDYQQISVDCYRVHAQLASGETASVRTFLVNEIEDGDQSEN